MKRNFSLPNTNKFFQKNVEKTEKLMLLKNF